MPGPLRALIKAMGERLSGSRPGVFRALAAAFAAAVVTYRFLRSDR
jgi:hypothetical protein